MHNTLQHTDVQHTTTHRYYCAVRSRFAIDRILCAANCIGEFVRRSQDQICSGKSLQFSELFFGILLSEFRFTVFIPGAVAWIHKSPTAILGQPIFLTNIWTALLEKEKWKEKPPRLRCSKMPRIWKEKSAEMSCVHFTRFLDLFWHYLKNFQELKILRKSSKNQDFFLEQIWSCDRREVWILFW